MWDWYTAYFSFYSPFPLPFLFLFLFLSLSYSFRSLHLLVLFLFPVLAHVNSLIKVWCQRLEKRYEEKTITSGKTFWKGLGILQPPIWCLSLWNMRVPKKIEHLLRCSLFVSICLVRWLFHIFRSFIILPHHYTNYNTSILSYPIQSVTLGSGRRPLGLMVRLLHFRWRWRWPRRGARAAPGAELSLRRGGAADGSAAEAPVRTRGSGGPGRTTTWWHNGAGGPGLGWGSDGETEKYQSEVYH